MSGEVEIRPYRAGDETAILELFQLTFGRPMAPAYWQWRFGNNPTGRIMIDLAWSGSTLAAHYAVSPVVVSMHGQDVLTALSMTTMTHPDFRGQGFFVTLADSVYRRMAETGMSMVWGFPNVLSHRGFIRDLSWHDIHEVPVFRRVLNEGRPLPEPSPRIVELDVFDGRFDRLWTEMEGRYPILTRRDSRYLAWRYGANPENRYTVLGCVDGNRLLGYAIYKPFQDSIDLVDLLCLDEKVGVDLTCGVGQRAAAAGAQSVGMWFNVSLPLHLELEKYGFRNAEPLTYFGARRLRPEMGSEVDEFRNWYLTMGDSDVY